MQREDDPFDLQRFLDAQGRVIDDVLGELRAGRKRTHWMWFIFPQIEGLGSSPMARKYAIGSEAEARAYLAHPVLGGRLREWARLIVAAGRPLADIFGRNGFETPYTRAMPTSAASTKKRHGQRPLPTLGVLRPEPLQDGVFHVPGGHGEASMCR